MPVCGKSLSFAQPLQSPCPGSGHFQPQKSSLSPPEVASSAPQSGHLEAKTTVGNLKVAARKKADRGKMPPLHTRRGGGNPWFYPETPVVPRWKDRRSRLFRRFQEQALHSPQSPGFHEDSEALAGFKARGCPPSAEVRPSVPPLRGSGKSEETPRRAKQALYALFGSSDGQRHSLRAKKAK